MNGIWKFQYSVNAKKRPVSFYENDYDISEFDEIQVPQHIELAGYDKIHYINTMYPWEGHEYRRPAGTCNHIGEGMFSEASYNPTGSYVRFFDLEEALIGKRVILSFEGAEQAIEVEGLPVTPYLVPQECGMHMETECVTVYRKDTLNNSDTSEETFGLTCRACGEKFGFSCLPYTSEELENATHQEELPLPRRTVVCICGSVRGVGGIDSWGSDVEDPYRISAQKDIVYEFVIE